MLDRVLAIADEVIGAVVAMRLGRYWHIATLRCDAPIRSPRDEARAAQSRQTDQQLPAQRVWQRPVSAFACRLQKVYRRRNRDVGQSDQVCGRQGGMIREAGDRCSINPVRSGLIHLAH